MAKLSPCVADCDSPHENIRETSKYVLSQELELSLHYGVMAVLLPRLSTRECHNFAHIISQYFEKHIPFLVASQLTPEAWERYQTLKELCEHSQSLGLCVDLDRATSAEVILSRNMGRPTSRGGRASSLL